MADTMPDHPLRLAKGSHRRGSGKGCAMNVISYINGDTEITDFPDCSARPLASLVQCCNDDLAEPDGYRYLSPENSFIVLDLAWRTVGTADVSECVVRLWLAEVLTNPVWGAIRYADERGAACLRDVADLHRATATGDAADAAARAAAYATARATARAAARDAADAAARDDAADAAAYAADVAAGAAAYAAAWAARDDAADAAAYAADAAAGAAAYAAAWAAWDAAAYAADAAAGAAARAAAWAAWDAACIDFTRHAIECWRQLAGLDDPQIDAAAVNSALAQIADR